MSGGDREKSYLVESYWPGVSKETLASAARRAHEVASDLRLRGGNVDFVSSIFVPADETVFWLFNGLEADVRAASEQAGVPFERVLESLHVDGNPIEEEADR
jgi:hypothetical protein